LDRRGFIQSVTCATSTALASRALAQEDWTATRPIRIVASAAGGILDIVARQLADPLQRAFGQPIVVENKPGGGGIVAMVTVKNSAPDGYTLGITTFVEMTINPWLYERLPYDPINDFQPVVAIYNGQILLAAHPTFPGDSIADVIRLAKEQPGRFFYASSGVARPPHVWMERFASSAGVDLVHVPYKGAGPLVQAVLSGEVPLAMEGAPALLPHVKAGKLKALAVTGDKRLVLLPQVPTFAESGVPGIGLTWVGLVAPAGTPAAVIARLNREVVKILRQDDVKASYEQSGRTIIGNSPSEFEQLIRQELPEWREVVHRTGLRPG